MGEMVYQKIKNFLLENGIKQSKVAELVEENFPDLKISKNKLNNILNGKVELSAEDFRIILIVLQKLFPKLEANYFYEC